MCGSDGGSGDHVESKSNGSDSNGSDCGNADSEGLRMGSDCSNGESEGHGSELGSNDGESNPDLRTASPPEETNEWEDSALPLGHAVEVQRKRKRPSAQ